MKLIEILEEFKSSADELIGLLETENLIIMSSSEEDMEADYEMILEEFKSSIDSDVGHIKRYHNRLRDQMISKGHEVAPEFDSF